MRHMDECHEILRRGDAQKRRAATAMNERSTRAHSVFVIGVRQERADTGGVLESRLFLVDLGGSERLGKSKANAAAKALVLMEGEEEKSRISLREYYEQRRRLQETLNINTGLFALKKVIDALHGKEKALREGRPAPHVPYQHSKLTMLLSASLGGNAKTAVVVTASAEPRHAVESIQSLRFGERCRRVENQAGVSQAALARALAAIDTEIEAVEALIVRDERWEERERVVEHVVSAYDDMAGEEWGEATAAGQSATGQFEKYAGEGERRVVRHTVVGKVLTGAEHHRERLEALLHQRPRSC